MSKHDYSITSRHRYWSLVKGEKYYEAEFRGIEVNWSQRYPLHFTPKDILQGEHFRVVNELQCLLSVNKRCKPHLERTRDYLEEEIYNLKFID